MKKMIMLVIMLMVASIPLMAVEVGGQIDVNYFMGSPEDDLVEPESYFGMGDNLNSNMWLKFDLEENLNGYALFVLYEPKSAGNNSGIDVMGGIPALVLIEELWVEKKGAFGQDALGLKFGKMEVPFNLDINNGITGSFTNGVALSTIGIGEIDFTWGLNISYDLGEGTGVINLTTFEGGGGLNASTLEDADSGLFNSMVLNWDTGADAFGVAGLGLVVGYAMLAQEGADTTGSVISIGGSYTLMDGNLILGLEIDITNNVANSLLGNMDDEGAMLIAFDVDYVMNEYSFGLSYEQITYNEIADFFGPGSDMESNTDSRMAIRASMALNDAAKVRFEYSTTGNSEDDDAGGTMIALGFLSTF